MGKTSKRNDANTDLSKEIGKRLRGLRVRYGESIGNAKINMHDFGKLLGLDYTTDAAMDNYIGKLERGEYAITPSETLLYSRLCGVSADYILCGTESERVPDLFDLCREIVNMDKCGLIDFVNDECKKGILITDIAGGYAERDYDFKKIGETFCRTDRMTAKENYTDTLRNFITKYCTIKELSSLDGITNFDWIIDDLINSTFANTKVYGKGLTAQKILDMDK